MAIIDEKTKLQIEQYLEQLETVFNVENDFSEDIEPVQSGGYHITGISVRFPDDMDYAFYTVDEFLDYMSDIDTFEEVDKSTARTSHVRQSVIYFRYNGFENYEDRLKAFDFSGEGFKVKVIKKPFLIGLVNAKNGNSDSNLGLGSMDPYIALEMKYTGKDRLKKKDEDKLFERITFFLSKELNTSIYIIPVRDVREAWDEIYPDEDEIEEPANTTVKVRDLISYSPMLKLYKQALATEDLEIRFLQFYKIIEHISPVVARLEAYDKLNKRLDILASSERDYKYLDSLFSITRKYDTDVKDDYLAISVIQSCVDVIPLWGYLPEKLRKQIKSTLHLQTDDITDDSIKDEQLASLQKQIANILYATRNNIVHAKSNYTPNGLELQGDELIDGNKMMDIIAMSIIQWNERQPAAYRI